MSHPIPVKTSSYPIAEDITVQLGYVENGEFILEECNHAGAEVEQQTSISWNYSREDIDEYDEDVLVCDKCGAYKLSDGSWEIAQ